MMSIYVETLIAGSIEEVWEKTQTPELHQRWDLRFSDIRYQPRHDPAQAQQFLYTTRVGFGVAICGAGETVGTVTNERQRTSALKFWSDDPKSLIHIGSGYWKYEQCADGVRFITGYDYKTRFGWFGNRIDRLIFRPLMAWATAWSFDRLRLWVEKGIDPARALMNSLIYTLARLTLVIIWLYQGLVPKLLFLQADERAMLVAAGLRFDQTALAVRVFGLVEVGFALALLLTWTRRRVLLLNIPIMIAALLGVAFTAPGYLVAAFNPVTLNLAVGVLALIAYLSSAELPSASHCVWRTNAP